MQNRKGLTKFNEIFRKKKQRLEWQKKNVRMNTELVQIELNRLIYLDSLSMYDPYFA